MKVVIPAGGLGTRISESPLWTWVNCRILRAFRIIA
jgi:hypothetical protein